MNGLTMDTPLLISSLAEHAARNFPDYRLSGYFGSMSLQLAAALAGMGATLLPAYLGDDHAPLSRVPPDRAPEPPDGTRSPHPEATSRVWARP